MRNPIAERYLLQKDNKYFLFYDKNTGQILETFYDTVPNKESLDYLGVLTLTEEEIQDPYFSYFFPYYYVGEALIDESNQVIDKRLPVLVYYVDIQSEPHRLAYTDFISRYKNFEIGYFDLVNLALNFIKYIFQQKVKKSDNIVYKIIKHDFLGTSDDFLDEKDYKALEEFKSLNINYNKIKKILENFYEEFNDQNHFSNAEKIQDILLRLDYNTFELKEKVID